MGGNGERARLEDGVDGEDDLLSRLELDGVLDGRSSFDESGGIVAGEQLTVGCSSLNYVLCSLECRNKKFAVISTRLISRCLSIFVTYRVTESSHHRHLSFPYECKIVYMYIAYNTDIIFTLYGMG